MEKIVAYCGIVCSDCPAYIATRQSDEAKKKKLAREWSIEGYSVEPEDINCNGCTNTCNNIHFKFCKECEIRSCGLEKKIESCAFCDKYPCEKLEKPFAASPKNKEVLDLIRNGVAEE